MPSQRRGTNLKYVIVRPLSTVGYTSAASVSTVDGGLTNLIHDRCKLWMCPLKRKQARCECKSELQDVNSL